MTTQQEEITVTQTVTVTTVVVVNNEPTSFTASGETDGSVHRLARALTRTVAEDFSGWSTDQEFEAERHQRGAARTAGL